MTRDDIQQKCDFLVRHYASDFSTGELVSECLHFKEYLTVTKTSDSSVYLLYQQVVDNKLDAIFPNLHIAFRIFLTLMVTNCSAERSFSKLKRIKNDMRNSMTQKRLNSFSLLNIEHEVMEKVDMNTLIDDFAKLKSCRKMI